jgi:HlyD family secretion protein
MLAALSFALPRQSVAVAAAAPTPGVVAAAPGWVDIEGGVQKLTAKTDGIIKNLPVKEADTVKAGSLLLQLDDAQAQLELSASRLQVQQQQQQIAVLRSQQKTLQGAIERLKPLVEQQAEPADELRQLQNQSAALTGQIALAQTAAKAAAVQQQLAAHKPAQLALKAPADGEILRVLAHVGDAVTAGTPLFWFAGNGPLLVRAELDERLFGQVKPGMTAQVSAEYGGERISKAKVLRVARLVGPVHGLPEARIGTQDDRVVECVLALEGQDFLIGQRVLVRILAAP